MSKVLPIPAKRHLPSKESGLFKELLTLYETRQLKKGLKTADQILKKFPEHGETICMKGLVLTHMGRRDEGLDLVKKGVRLDLTSHICWHVFGLIQKGEKNYEEALKSYTQALRFDKDNMNILRDAASLQTQLRLFDSLVETRHTIIKLRPTLRQHWIALAVAYHLNGNLTEAKKTLEHYEKTLKNVPDHDVEQSETILYHVRLLEEMGEYSEALSLLDGNSKARVIVDRLAVMEIRARLLSTLKSEDAETAWRALLEYNSESYEYYKGFLANRGIALDSPNALPVLRNFMEQLPKAAAPRRFALSITSGADFHDLVKPYLLTGLTKGIPSLFVDIKGLYVDDSKRQIVEEIVEAARNGYAGDAPQGLKDNSDPTVYVWTLYFLSQHYSFLRQLDKALEIINIAIEHTPTLPELHTCKGRIYKRAGDPYNAVKAINEARLLDGQDRFLNTKCGKYLLRAGFVQEANAVFGLFTKKDAVSPGQDLEDMQSMLYLLEEADAHNRNGKPNLALKKYLAVVKVFNEVEDDQYDFHGYNLRKFTLSAYLNLIKWEDQLRSHPAYVKAALSAAKIYVSVHDDPSIATSANSAAPLTDAEKKAKKKAKKAAQKEKAQEDPKKGAAQSANEDKGLEAPAAKDEDPEGIKLLTVSDPLEQAAKLLAPLADLAGDDIGIWVGIYDVAVRRTKLLQAARALAKVRSIDADHPELHVRLAHFQKRLSSLSQEPPAPLGPALSEVRAELFSSEVGLETYNSQYLQRSSGSAAAILSAAKVLHLLQSSLQEVESTIFTTFESGTTLDIETALLIVDFLRSIKAPRLQEFRKACAERFPLSKVFDPETDIEALKKMVMAEEEESKDESDLA